MEFVGGGAGERSSPALPPKTPLPTPFMEGLGEGAGVSRPLAPSPTKELFWTAIW